jgi:enamine deaminase RidA (YjgF/YER057c/UK114 family)
MTTSANLRFINPATLATPPGYTHVVAASRGQTIYVSGQVALDATGQVVGAGDVAVQARQAFENLRLALNAAGAELSDVVKLTTFVTDMASARPAFRAARDAVITSNPPASTLVEVSRLFRDEFLIEVEAVAVRA